MKKKTFKMIIIFSIVLGLIGFSIFYFYPRVLIKNIELNYEYGETINLKVKDLIWTNKNKIYQNTIINTNDFVYEKNNKYPQPGKYKLEIEYKIFNKKIKKIKTLTVTDSTPPEFTSFIEEVELNQNSSKKDYIDKYSAKDLSNVLIDIDDANVDYKIPGEYKVMVIAFDESNNKTKKEATIIIKKTIYQNNPNEKVGTYINGILIVNKKYSLPSTYAPGENKEAKAALINLISAMQKEGLNVGNSYSGYRSYSTQANIYANNVNKKGKKEADKYSAKPGHSEHQSGLAFDLTHADGQLLHYEKEATWLLNNAHNYGFIVRYQAGKEHITGYSAEPWHLRYLGIDIATNIHNSGLTLEEYLGALGGDYNE